MSSWSAARFSLEKRCCYPKMSSARDRLRTGPGSRGFRFRRRLGRRSFRLRQPEQLAQLGVDRVANVGVVPQKLARILPALSDSLAFIAEPRTALLNDVLRHAEVDQVALARDAFAIDDVELRFAKRRCNFVLHHLDLCAAADDVLPVFDGRDPAYVQPYGRVELQRAPSGSSFGVAKHHANLFADLVDEYEARLRFRYDAGQLSKRLRHEPRLNAHVAVAHLAIELGLWNERGHGIDHQ